MKVREPVSINGNRQSMNKEPDPEVVPKAKRRRFSVEYKLRILAEADNRTERGEIGALLRREGLYSSHLTDWRKQRERGDLDGQRSRKRGHKPDPQAVEITRLQRKNDQLRSRLERAGPRGLPIIDVQKKLAHRRKNWPRP